MIWNRIKRFLFKKTYKQKKEQTKFKRVKRMNRYDYEQGNNRNYRDDSMAVTIQESPLEQAWGSLEVNHGIFDVNKEYPIDGETKNNIKTIVWEKQ